MHNGKRGFQKGHAKIGGRRYGTGNKRNGYRLVKKRAVVMEIKVTAPAASPTPVETTAQFDPAIRQGWSDQENARLAKLAQTRAFPISNAELNRRAAAEAGYAARHPERNVPTRARDALLEFETLEKRNRLTAPIPDYPAPEVRIVREMIEQAERDAIAAEARARASAKGWSPFNE